MVRVPAGSALEAHGQLSVGFVQRERISMSIPWWGYVIGAGLAWGTYVPLVFFGGTELTTKPGTIGGGLASYLIVRCASFLAPAPVPRMSSFDFLAIRLECGDDGPWC